MRLKTVLCSLTLIAVATAGGKTWSADQSKITVLVDNDKVKVIRITGPAGNHQEVDSDDHVVIPLKDLKKETRNGKTEVLQRDVGKAYWRKGGPRTYDYLSDSDMIIVDLKPGKGTSTK